MIVTDTVVAMPPTLTDLGLGDTREEENGNILKAVKAKKQMIEGISLEPVMTLTRHAMNT
jgi:hypothetical protein